MQPPPEVVKVTSNAVHCDGSGEVSPALGHPRVFLRIDDKGFVECGYCDRRFVLVGGAADKPGDSRGAADKPGDSGGAADRDAA